jgi:hypothetical protein
MARADWWTRVLRRLRRDRRWSTTAPG